MSDADYALINYITPMMQCSATALVGWTQQQFIWPTSHTQDQGAQYRVRSCLNEQFSRKLQAI